MAGGAVYNDSVSRRGGERFRSGLCKKTDTFFLGGGEDLPG